MSLKVNDIVKDERELDSLIRIINRYMLCSIIKRGNIYIVCNT